MSKPISLKTIEKALQSDDPCIREAAMNACVGRDVPYKLIRTIEPPELVYKKCLANVIVVAEIPKNAQVRGAYGYQCRSDKAIIRDIIGDFYGEKVGISNYDKVTTYYIGDEVFIEDFDMSNSDCSNGFHFFCTKEEAEKFKF